MDLSQPTTAQLQPPVVQPDLTPSQKFDQAVNSGDIKQIMQVAAEHADTPVGVAAVKASGLMLKGDEIFNSMVDPIKKAGGLGTPEGNLVAADTAKKYFKQEDPKIRDALVYWLTGNDKMAKAMIHGGDTAVSIVPDINGKMIEVTKNELGKIVNAQELGGRKLSVDEYNQRAVGRQSYENLLTFKNQDQQQKENIIALKKTEAAKNAWGSASPQLEANNVQMYDQLGHLKKIGKELDAKTYANIMGVVSTSLGAADSSSKGSTILDQFNQDRSAYEGKTLTSEQTFALGLGKENKAGWKWTNKGIETKDGRETKSSGELRQNTNTENTNKEISSNVQKTREALFNDAKFKKLKEEDQRVLLNILENAKQLGQKQTDLASKHDVPTFMVLPSSVDISDNFSVAQAKAVQGIFNAKAMTLYENYYKDVIAKSNGVAPNPYEIEAGFTRTPEYKALLAQAKAQTNALMTDPSSKVNPGVSVDFSKSKPINEQPSNEAKVPPPTQNEPRSIGKAPPKEEATPKGVPKGSRQTGLVTDKGQPLWRAPDGSLHTKD